MLVEIEDFKTGWFGLSIGIKKSQVDNLIEALHKFKTGREDGAVFTLHYDQVGSLRVVADAHGDVIKEVLYDPFGGIIKDTNPSFRVPIGFAGGLHDRDLGFVRFGWRDYDVNTGRWTAPDPIGDKGGDPD